ncbi:MAG: RNA methyltransferase [Chloroflexi bacterium]|nr:RNA methyltransferase [Chloroflexota bacterium]MCL5273692.1 RNA methyltransferase [Chloroflexota bacterium]
MLTSTQNKRVKLARQLQHQRDSREREGLFVAEGARLVDDFIRAGLIAQFAFATGDTAGQQWQADHAMLDTLLVDEAVMRAVSVETHPPGVLAVFSIPATSPEQIRSSLPGQILILDAIRDPGNLGACLRVAAGADGRLVILSPGSVDPYNPKVLRGGMGAHARLIVSNMDWDAIHDVCQGRSVWAAEAVGSCSYDSVPWRDPNAVIIGGEATGISADAHRLASGTISIPLANQVESLNAAVACGVILFEAARQRRAPISN